MKKKLTVEFLTISVCVLLTGCHIKHEWQEATCTTPKTCSVCGETEGEALGHDWQEATCTTPKTCSVCGETEGEALGHTWQDATCTTPKTCSVCGETEGEALGHDWQEATCITPKTCSVCGETEGEVAGHVWQEANCLAPKTCSICGATEGDIGDHVWVVATCLAPKTCSVCGETEGELASHNFNENGICTVCGTSREIQLTMDNVNDFFTVSYDTEYNTQYTNDSNHRRVEKLNLSTSYNWTTVTVTPTSNDYIFEDVQICIGFDSFRYSEGKTKHYDTIYGIREPEKYSLDNENSVIIEFRWNSRYSTLKDVMITYISGTCIRK